MGVRLSSVVLGAALLAVGLLAAAPFLTNRLVGTGEGFNYSLSVADAVVQMRHGIVPPLAGQTEYAFNGRIHPLRNAPYLSLMAGALDAVTLRRLQFWELQNACLALSLIASVFACYLGLRWATSCPRALAFFLAAAYGLSPSLLSLTHTLNLFMTVHAAVFVPLAVAACVRGCLRPSLAADLLLAAALALAWLAHPPVALWLTWGVILVRIVSFAGAPGWRPVARAAAAAALGVLLSGFVLVSVGTLNSDLKYFAAGPGDRAYFANGILSNLRLALPGALLPVGRAGNGYDGLQFGYVAWALLALTVLLLLRARRSRPGPDHATRLAAAGSVLVVCLLLLLSFPVPGITHWLWLHMPMPVLQMTSLWPMQRLYIIGMGFTAFGAALIFPSGWPALTRKRWVAPALIAGALAWTLYEAYPAISFGFVNRRTQDGTLAAFRPSNLDLTVTSYAYFGVPPTFINGVDDPRFEYRLLNGKAEAAASNLDAGLAQAAIVQRGSFLVSGKSHEAVVGTQEILLLPGHRYLITFDFKVPPFVGWIEFKGPLLRRSYALPESGEPMGFGMVGRERRTLAVSTDSDELERVAVTIGVTDGGPFAGRTAVVANYTLRDVPMDALPVRQVGYLPLRLEVNASQPGWAVETPQRFLDGYEATVDGLPAQVLMSPWRNVMVGVPEGRSDVEVRYVGPRLVREAFWVSVSCWAGFLAWLMARALLLRPALSAAACVAFVWRLRFFLAAAAAAGAAALYLSRRAAESKAYLAAVGPIEIRFRLRQGAAGTSQPLLATGHAQAGAVVFATFLDGDRIRLGADIGGTAYSSEPIEMDYSKAHTLVVSDSALFPLTHPLVAQLPPDEAARLRREVRVELDGSPAIEADGFAYEASRSEIHVGSAPFGSLAPEKFTGKIIEFRRLPIPRAAGMPLGGRAHLKLRFHPDRPGLAESLLTFGPASGAVSYSATYLGAGRLRIFSSRQGGAILQSAEVEADLSRAHTINFWPSLPHDPTEAFGLSCDFDGRQILGSTRPLIQAACPIPTLGADMAAPREGPTRLSGPELNLTLTVDGTSTGAIEDYGPAHMILSLPAQKNGRQEPILTTGRNGAGDLVYLVYEDDHHIRVGFDHWGAKGALSDPIAVDYQSPHDIWVIEGSLYPSETDNALWGAIAPSVRSRLKSTVAVVIDGKAALSASSATYPSTRSEVTFARNPIGGSTADPEFSGTIHYAERTGSVLPPGLKL